MNDSQVFFEITVRAGSPRSQGIIKQRGSPRSQGIIKKRAANSPGLLNISHGGTKPQRYNIDVNRRASVYRAIFVGNGMINRA